MIDVLSVTKRFGKAKILDNISLHVGKGTVHGLVGRNGCGKTMLMRCICGFILADEGTIHVDGRRVGREVDFPARTGIIIEAPGFVDAYTGFENLRLLSRITRSGVSSDAIKRLLATVGLDSSDKKPVRKYSLGMRQRLGIAQAMLDNPDLLILDEPMNGLDMEGVAEMRSLLLKMIADGKTLLLASHNSEDIHALCDEVHMMDKGRIIETYQGSKIGRIENEKGN